jgi:hypothetical protein
MEVPGEMFDGTNVTINGALSVVATLQFFEHDLAQMGHRETSFSANQVRSAHSSTSGNHARDSVRRTSGFVQVSLWEVQGLDYEWITGKLEMKKSTDANRPPHFLTG